MLDWTAITIGAAATALLVYEGRRFADFVKKMRPPAFEPHQRD